MRDQMKNLLIGIFTAAALLIVIFMILFLHPYAGDQGLTLRVRFTDIDKVNAGTRVLLAGKPVGEVKTVKLLDEVNKARIERNGDVYVYELELAVDSGLKVYNTDRISLRTSGLLGEKSVSIDPEPARSGEKLRVVNDEILYAEGVGSVEDTFKDFKAIADKFDFVLDLVSDALKELRDRHTWENVSNTVENFSDLSTKLNDSWTDVHDSLRNIADTSENAKQISEKMNTGEGTLGKLIATDDLYLRTNSLMGKGETILDDINHYGLLFSSDKGWQRLRARRMNMLEKLRTPQEFRNYFNDEINQISTSLSRVGMVLERTENNENLMNDNEYKKVFTELLRRVDMLEEALRMYNIQAVDKETQKTELRNE